MLPAPTVLITFNEGSGAVANDNAGTNNKLTLQGTNAAAAWGTSGGVNSANGAFLQPSETGYGEWLTADRFPLSGQFTIFFWASTTSTVGGRTLFDLGNSDAGGSGTTGNATLLAAIAGSDTSRQSYDNQPQIRLDTAAGSFPADGAWRFYAAIHGATTVSLVRVESNSTVTTLGTLTPGNYNPANFFLTPSDQFETYVLGNDAPGFGSDRAAWAGGIDYFGVTPAELTTFQLRELRVAAEKNYDAGSGAISIDVDAVNVLTGGATNDILDGLGGDDTLNGGAGADLMVGGTGNDQYIIDNAGDTVREFANEGLDTAWVGGGASTVTIGANVEIIRMYAAGQFVAGSDTGEIFVTNSTLASTVSGNGGDDEVFVVGTGHTVSGGGGDDIIRGQPGASGSFAGNAGNDQFVITTISTVLMELAAEGIDTAWVAVTGWTNFANVEIVRLAAAGAVTLFGNDGNEDLVANQGEASRLDGNGGIDVLWGSGFADTLNGGAGDDILRGQGGADAMAGGAGNDQYVVFDSGASVTELFGEGYDIVYVAGTGSFFIGDNVEEARLVAQGNGLVGNALANLMAGNSSNLASTLDGAGGNDIIFGSTAADQFIGGAGDDTLYSQGGADVFIYNAPGWGVDQIAGFGSGAKLQFTAASGVTAFSQLSLNVAGGNTQVNHANGVVLVFGATLTASDFIFG